MTRCDECGAIGRGANTCPCRCGSTVCDPCASTVRSRMVAAEAPHSGSAPSKDGGS